MCGGGSGVWVRSGRGACQRGAGDNGPLHVITDECQGLSEYDHGRVRSWIKRVDALPRSEATI